MSMIIEEAGEESAPSSQNPHGAASNPGGSEKSQERGEGYPPHWNIKKAESSDFAWGKEIAFLNKL